MAVNHCPGASGLGDRVVVRRERKSFALPHLFSISSISSSVMFDRLEKRVIFLSPKSMNGKLGVRVCYAIKVVGIGSGTSWPRGNEALSK
jgi:hypothetical protein